MEANKCNRLWNAKLFDVTGYIVFSMINSHTLLDKENLRSLVDRVDRDHPWSSYYRDTPHTTRIIIIGDAKMSNPDQWHDREYTISIREQDQLKPDQFYAYSRYLACLAENLATVCIESVHTVKARIDIRGDIALYLTPMAQKKLGAKLLQHEN